MQIQLVQTLCPCTSSTGMLLLARTRGAGWPSSMADRMPTPPSDSGKANRPSASTSIVSWPRDKRPAVLELAVILRGNDRDFCRHCRLRLGFGLIYQRIVFLAREKDALLVVLQDDIEVFERNVDFADGPIGFGRFGR